jgi:Tn3 transposase DDE domain-containing protein
VGVVVRDDPLSLGEGALVSRGEGQYFPAVDRPGLDLLESAFQFVDHARRGLDQPAIVAASEPDRPGDAGLADTIRDPRADSAGRTELPLVAWCLTLVTNAVVAWSTEYYGLAVEQMRAAGRRVDDEVLAHISPAYSENTNSLRCHRG